MKDSIKIIFKYQNFIYAFIILYFFLNTGIHSDDYNAIQQAKSSKFFDFFNPNPEVRGQNTFGIINHYIFYWSYEVFTNKYEFLYDIFKWLIHVVSIYLIYIFALDYLKKDRALLASILFIFFPIHDSTTYWFMTTTYIFTPALIMYCHYLFRNEKIYIGMPVLFLASFLSYSSPPYIFGLSIIFLFERLYKKSFLFILPGIFYTLFYFFISFSFGDNIEKRIDYTLTFSRFIKNFSLQFFTSIDVILGPSFWIKIYLSITSISLFSLILSILLIFFFRNKLVSKKPSFPLSLILGLFMVFFLALIMFSLTSFYPQTSFNLGNRVTLYSSLLVAFILSTFQFSKKFYVILIFIFILPIFGLSDHWKLWNNKQKIIISNLENNLDFQNVRPEDAIVVNGNMYSKLGNFSHIDFFITQGVVQSVVGKYTITKNIMSIPSYVFLKNEKLIDPKIQQSIELSNKIFHYDSEKNILSEITLTELSSILSNQSAEIRHWVQLINYSPLKKFILYLSPRLGYLFV